MIARLSLTGPKVSFELDVSIVCSIFVNEMIHATLHYIILHIVQTLNYLDLMLCV